VDLLLKPQVEQPVGLVQDQELDRLEGHAVRVQDVIQEATRCRDEEIVTFE
jgi:hypothetical protein